MRRSLSGLALGRIGAGLGLYFALSLGVGSLTICDCAQANPELDKRYALETVGVLRSWDNVDGLFSEYVANAYREYFSHQSRFNPVDLSKADEVLAKSKLPYNQAIEDKDILAQIARSFRCETFVRTKIYQEGPRYRFTIDWLHAPKLEVLASESFMMNQPESGKAIGFEELRRDLEDAFTRLLRKLPFEGSVNGRDGDSVTLNLGRTAGVNRGDRISIGTLDEVKLHPLLNQVVDWRTSQTGQVRVEEVEESLSFAKVVEEDEAHPISRYQKIIQISAAPEPAATIEDDAGKRPRNSEPPRLGYAELGLGLGNYSRDFSSNAAGTLSSGGFMWSGHVAGQLWMTADFFFDLGFGYDSASGGVSVSQFNTDVGYNFYSMGGTYGSKAWVKLGYAGNSTSMPVSSATGAGASSLGSLMIGLGGDLPVRGGYGALVDLGFGGINSGSADAIDSSGVQGSQQVSFYLGGYFRINPHMTARLGLGIEALSLDLVDSSSISQKMLTFGPTLLYYF